jgi:hypothetical protein
MMAAQAAEGRAVRRIHHRFGVLPGGKGATTDPATPHAQRRYPPAVSEAKIIYLFVDLLIGWLVQARPFIARGGCLLVERGWWDLAVDPRRYRLRDGWLLVRWLGKLVPRSDLLVVLEGSSALLWSRKQECPESELARQTQAWRRVVPPSARVIYLDASLPLMDLVERVTAELDRSALTGTAPSSHD